MTAADAENHIRISDRWQGLQPLNVFIGSDATVMQRRLSDKTGLCQDRHQLVFQGREPVVPHNQGNSFAVGSANADHILIHPAADAVI